MGIGTTEWQIRAELDTWLLWKLLEERHNAPHFHVRFMPKALQGFFALTKTVTRFDPRYRSAWRSCINLRGTAATKLMMISCISVRP
jgi:hypothetical protein